MEFFQLLKERRSIRAFQAKEVEEEKLRKLLEAANSAPSAGNLQAYEIYLVRSDEKKAGLARAALGQMFIAQAPVVLVFCSNPQRSALRYGERGSTLYALQDATIACTHAHLAAVALGLGSVWIGAFDETEVARILGLKEGIRPIAILPIGYPAEKPWPTPRRKLEDLVHEVS
jgi:nitroreductase